MRFLQCDTAGVAFQETLFELAQSQPHTLRHIHRRRHPSKGSLTLRSLVVERVSYLAVHVAYDLHASLMLLHCDHWRYDRRDLVGKLNDVNFVGVDTVWQFLVAIEIDLLDEFFT
jgi:hypothetical protein